MSRPATTERMTAEAFMALPDDGRVLELWEGVVVEMPPPGREHGRLLAVITYWLSAFVRQRGIGEVVAGDSAVIVSRRPDSVLGADAAVYVDAPRRRSRRPGASTEPPDLVVEIASPSDRPRAIRDKADRWLAAGVAEVWIVWPEEDVIEAVREGIDPIRYASGETLTTELLPGFELPLTELFGG